MWLKRVVTRAVVVEREPIDPDRYQYAYPDGTSMLQISMRHLDGIDWGDAELPPENHVCWAQSKAYDHPYRISRCACGAISMRAAGERTFWDDKNSTRRYREQQAAS